MRAALSLAAATALAVPSCSPASIEDTAAEFFIECMTERNVPVDNVHVEVRVGRHIERLEWDAAGRDDVESIGDDCEEQTLRRFEITRT